MGKGHVWVDTVINTKTLKEGHKLLRYDTYHTVDSGVPCHEAQISHTCPAKESQIWGEKNMSI